jgi:uncharacterized protein DUF3565
VEQTIVGFEQDEHGDWVAHLSCTHRRHVRHQPPWREHPWVLTEEGRRGRIGSRLECGLCEQPEPSAESEGDGGDPACWAHQVCPECGAVVEGGAGGVSGHRPGCTASAQGRVAPT